MVPLLQAMACFTPQKAAKLASNSVMKRPMDEIQLVVMHSITYSASRPSSTGMATGMRGRLMR